MNRYRVIITQTTIIRNIEAENKEEAREIACDEMWERNRGDTSYQCLMDIELLKGEEE